MAAWSSEFGSVPSAGSGPASVGARYTVGVSTETANQPDSPLYTPCLAITVRGSKAAQASASPPNSRVIVCCLVPAVGPSWPSMSTNAPNSSGCIMLNVSAQVPPADQPTTPQLAGSRLTPKLEIMYGTTSLVR